MPIKCSFCDKVIAKSETKSCGSCKAVIYCNAQIQGPVAVYQSRECQKGSWKHDHKQLCIRISNPQNENDELRLWCTFWSTSLLYATVWALDIVNNPGHNMKHALLIFVKKTERTEPGRRYKIFGQCFVPLTMPKLKFAAKTISPGHFFLSVQDPIADDGFGLQWHNPAYEVFPTIMSKPRLALLAKLAVPILRHLTETVSNVNAMTMWDPNVWLAHPFVKPEEVTVLPEEFTQLADMM